MHRGEKQEVLPDILVVPHRLRPILGGHRGVHPKGSTRRKEAREFEVKLRQQVDQQCHHCLVGKGLVT